ncbi:transcriptional regulator, LacI family [Chitinophaga terrae (ex Kim and Jung 2007)]|uniref:Transcriptional regulator, LacI family n=1 Tax=Chitinophaga terrae (ex Kim and Jung 2007) TaxID=408074 RepID=A0A1H4A2A3_9BACT|nr:LacI family DNA-binding transcriptional regulator [Chitinophaga terrae (ex Kim and Jung 2007)]GEP90015.1 LacI family transcriptional regulator [Chitinophaga terrae (ex Kim and Jung 2007)]SEA30169.1 transcriptional regulator, LacI family [Chitinophaga terrae (ex Kim and Jung 2007)]
MRRHYATIKDIAYALSISVSTVSRALRDTHDVNADTRKMVLEMAAKLNYKPNFNATGLVKNSTHNLAVILPAITNYYFSTVFTGIQEVAYSNGYNLILYVTNDDAAREENIVRNLSFSSLDGLLVSVSSKADASHYFQEIIDDGVPVVFFDRVVENIRTSKVMQDDYNGAYEATVHLIRNGYRKIAHITGPAGLTLTEARLQGYLDALQRHKLAVRKKWIIHSGFSQQSGEEDARQLWKLNDKPDAVFAVNDRKGIGAIISFKQLAVQVGKEIGIIGFTNDPMSSIISPSLSTIAEPAFEIGQRSCQLLLNHIRKKHFIPEEVILPGRLIVRESSRRS